MRAGFLAGDGGGLVRAALLGLAAVCWAFLAFCDTRGGFLFARLLLCGEDPPVFVPGEGVDKLISELFLQDTLRIRLYVK